MIPKLTVSQAEDLQEDLVQAFNGHAFQLRLLTLRQAGNSDPRAKRETAMVAQQDVLLKYGFSSGTRGVGDMVLALTSFFEEEECLSRTAASKKAKALSIGMESGRRHGWSWPRLSSDDTASTALPRTDADDVAAFSDDDSE